MDDFNEEKIEFEPQDPNESVQKLTQTLPGIMASACEDEISLCGKLLKVQQVRSEGAVMDPLLRVDYEFWTKPNQFDAANPELVTYRREHLYVRRGVLENGELFFHGMGPEFCFEQWFQDDFIAGNPDVTALPEEGYAALLQEVTDSNLNAIAEYLVDYESGLPQGIREDMLRLYHGAEIARRQADEDWEEQEARRVAERQLANPTWDPQSLHFVQHTRALTLRLFSLEKQFIWTASVSLLSGDSISSIKLSKGRKVPSPLDYVPVSKATVEAPCPIEYDNAETTLRTLFSSGWLSQQLETLK